MKNRGSILVLALWSVVLMSVLCISLGYGVRQKAVLINRLVNAQSLREITYSGIERARGVIQAVNDPMRKADTLTSPWANQSANFREIAIGDRGAFSISHKGRELGGDRWVDVYGLTDEERKIPLNFTDPQTMAALLENTVEMGHSEAEELAYAIIDWQDKDFGHQHPQYGAEDSEYGDLDLPYEAKDAPYECLEELYLVKGINAEIFDKIKDFVTPFGEGAVNINTAPKEVLWALSRDQYLADKIIKYRAGPDQDEGTSDDRFFGDVNTIFLELNGVILLNLQEQAEIEKMVTENKLTTISKYFSVRCRGTLNKNGSFMDSNAVIDTDGRVLYHHISEIQLANA